MKANKRYGVPLKPDSPRKSALAKIKIEAIRIANNGTRDGFNLAERLFKALPELRAE
jgi:hypothetical protein